MLNANARATGKPLKISPEAETLSKDVQFVEMVNSIFNFSAEIYLHSKQDALSRYVGNMATESDIKEIVEAAGVKSMDEILALFTSIDELRKNINEKYSFLTHSTKSKTILQEAMTELAKDKKITKAKDVEIDCLVAFMVDMAACYWMYDQCWVQINNANNQCVAAVTLCITLTFNVAGVCFNLY